MRSRLRFSRRALLAAPLAAARAQNQRRVFVVPNFHPASCGWLTNFSMERVYCANSYFDHLDRVRDDPAYSFVLSECNNLIAMMNFRPERTAELKAAVKSGRVELVNAFFLESTINLSGGEALVRLGIEGLRWQRKVFGVRPRFAWCIDVCGAHPQMAQITAGLGLDAFVYCRGNSTGSAVHWFESPDGTRVPAISPGHYSELRPAFTAKQALTEKEAAEIRKQLDARATITPAGAPVLLLAGSADYSLAPARADYPTAFLREWKQLDPRTDLRFTTLSKYFDEIAPLLASGRLKIPTMRGGTQYFYYSFWIQSPRVKTWFRRCEHQLLAAEMLSTAASLRAGFPYPAATLYRAWLQMFLNMDRNTLWGAAGGMVFDHETSWDALDRFRHVETSTGATLDAAARALAPPGRGVCFFNALNWPRRDPVVLAAADVPRGAPAELMPGGRAVCLLDLPAASLAGFARAAAAPAAPAPVPWPEAIETRFYTARVDARSGALTSLRLKPSGLEMLGGPANVIAAEKPQKQSGDPGDHMQFRPDRVRLASSSEAECRVTATRGPVATTVTAESTFYGGGALRRVARYYHDSPRIDFETTLHDIPDRTVVVAEFPLASDVKEVRRAIPYGFTHSAWPEPDAERPGFNQGITPAVRWSHYTVEGGGFAILDRGLSGRELNGRTPVIYLLNATDKYYGYPNSWLSGKGEHTLEYAILAHEGGWPEVRIQRAAWQYNSPPLAFAGSVAEPLSILDTSDNVVVECVRRDGAFVEVRLAECLGRAGSARVTLHLPHTQAAQTDLLGGKAQSLRGGPAYSFPVRPQQIVTLRFRTAQAVAEPAPLLEWDPLVPEPKRPALRRYSPEKGHPPRGV
jgi:alpha-mannosidase